jgi:tetrahydromethanopterin S-methyltransferase subunit A
MLEDYFEEEEEEEQQPVSAELAVTNNGQWNQPSRLCSGGQRKGTVRQMWRGRARGALFRGISHKSKFLIYHPLCEHRVCRDKTVIHGATDFTQQPELCE